MARVDGDDTPRPLAEIAHRARISRSTLVNWGKRSPGLQLKRLANGHPGVSWRQLMSFCEQNPHLRSAAKVLAANSPTAGHEAGARDRESILTAARSAQTAAAAHLDALIEAARQAEQSARSHREQLESLRVAFRAYEDVVSVTTAPRTLND
jgi:hypothetical protein